MRKLLKRWWIWAGMLFLVVAVLAGYLLIPVEQPRISQKNCDKIQIGWSLAQVEQLLEGCGMIMGRTDGTAILFVDEDGRHNLHWTDDDENTIEVVFEDLKRVTAKRYIASELSVVERAKRRIERRINALWP